MMTTDSGAVIHIKSITKLVICLYKNIQCTKYIYFGMNVVFMIRYAIFVIEYLQYRMISLAAIYFQLKHFRTIQN